MTILNKVIKELKRQGVSIPTSPVSLKKQDGDQIVEAIRLIQYELDNGVIEKDVNVQVSCLVRLFHLTLEALALSGNQDSIDELFLSQLQWIASIEEKEHASFDASDILKDYIFTPKDVQIKSSFTDGISEVTLKKDDLFHAQYYDPEDDIYKGYQKNDSGEMFGPELEVPVSKCKKYVP